MSKMRCLLLAVGVFLFLHASPGLAATATFAIDPKLNNDKETLPGLDGGDPRPIAVLAGPAGQLTEVVANEILLHPRDEKELEVFLLKYDGKILRDGMPFVDPELLPKDHPPIESNGWYLIRIDPDLSPLDDLEKNLSAGPFDGEYRFSSEEAARHFAILLREQNLGIGPNLILRPQAIPEHPINGGNLNAETFWWLVEDDDPAMPGDQGVSTGVIRAWDYLRYHQLPPQNGTYRPARIGIIDGGFALDLSNGTPLDGNLDYGFGVMQTDMVNQDPYAGGANQMQCHGGHSCPWHGQEAFGVAAAEPGNHFGGAGTGGRVVWPLLVKVVFDLWTVGDGIRAASFYGADVLSLSLSGGCREFDWACRASGFGDIYQILQAAVYQALSTSQVVVAAAGNDGVDIGGGSDPIPCKLDGVICVGSVDRAGMNVYNFGSPVDIWAPTHIRSTVTPESRAVDSDDVGADEVASMGGTSASTPFVAGVVGLMKVLDPAITPQRVRDILQMTANPSPDPKVHIGSIDALRAVQEVRANQPPVVQWAGPASGSIPWTGAFLTAQASDPEVDPQSWWQWPMTVSFSSNVDGPLCSDWIPTYGCVSGPLTLGNHVITVTATDAFGATSSATRNFQAINRPPTADIAEPVPNGTYIAHQPVRLEAYVVDPDELIPDARVAWNSDRDGALGTGPTRNVMLTAGAHVISVVATDGRGATGQDSVTITVQPGTGLPSVQILQPAYGHAVAPGTMITFRGQANDPEDGALTGASLVWSSDRDGVLGTGQTINVVLSGPASPCSSENVVHTVRLRATDSNGNSVAVTIRISVGMVC